MHSMKQDQQYGFKFNILNNNLFSTDSSESPSIPPVIGNFLLLDNANFLLLDNTNFLLL